MDWHGLARHRGGRRLKKAKGTPGPGTQPLFFLRKYRGKMIWTKTHVILDSRCSFCFCMFHPFSTFATKKPSKYLLHSAGKTPCLWFLAVPELEEHVLPPIRVRCSWFYSTFSGWRVVMLLQFAQVKFVKGTFAQNLRPCVPYGMNHDTRESCLNWTAGVGHCGYDAKAEGKRCDGWNAQRSSKNVTCTTISKNLT